MNLKSFAGGMLVAVFLIGALGQIGVSADRMSANDTLSIPAETVAGYVHAIIQADRATYTTQIVDRMQLRGITVASENWEQRGTLPLPVQFLRESSRLVAENQKGVSFKLISLWPINQRNATYERVRTNRPARSSRTSGPSLYRHRDKGWQSILSGRLRRPGHLARVRGLP